MKIEGSLSVRSIAEYVPDAGCRYVLDLLLYRHRLFLLIMLSNFFPFGLVFLDPHMILWLLKSPKSMKGFGSCFIRLFNSTSSIGSCGGIYMEQMLTVLCKVAFTAIACSLV